MEHIIHCFHLKSTVILPLSLFLPPSTPVSVSVSLSLSHTHTHTRTHSQIMEWIAV